MKLDSINITQEIYPLKVRGKAMSIRSLTNWVVSLSFLTLIQIAGGSETLWIYCLAGIYATILGYFSVPETKGQSLEKIEDHFRSGKHPREMGK